jgi:hypothetical protein
MNITEVGIEVLIEWLLELDCNMEYYIEEYGYDREILKDMVDMIDREIINRVG